MEAGSFTLWDDIQSRCAEAAGLKERMNPGVSMTDVHQAVTQQDGQDDRYKVTRRGGREKHTGIKDSLKKVNPGS